MLSPASGALPTLFATTSPDARGGCYYGPGGFAGLPGATALGKPPPAALNVDAAARLWLLAEVLTSVTFDGLHRSLRKARTRSMPGKLTLWFKSAPISCSLGQSKERRRTRLPVLFVKNAA